jgi:uncharacterized protein (TIGR00266 family)
MNHIIKGGSAYASVRIELEPGEWVKAEKNSMVAMSGQMKLSARADGGFLRGLARKFSGESFFFQEIKALEQPGWALLAPAMPGAVVAIDLHGRTGITAEKGAFLAATPHVDISSKMQRLIKSLFGGEGFIVVKISGKGTVFLNGFGGIELITLLPDQTITVDTTHLVAWEDSVEYTIGKGATSWTSAALTGEGLAIKMSGPGRVWVQTRTAHTFREWLGVLPPSQKSDKS